LTGGGRHYAVPHQLLSASPPTSPLASRDHLGPCSIRPPGLPHHRQPPRHPLLGNGVAWASGTDGTVLRTLDGGAQWQTCPIPPGAENLDFRGVPAFDQNAAIVMSSGKGDLSRLYKTTDSCRTWKLLFTNPDKEGFWDAIQFRAVGHSPAEGRRYWSGMVIGDPVDDNFVEYFSNDSGEHWTRIESQIAASARDQEGLFAASNSSLLYLSGGGSIFVTGGRSGSRSRVLSENVKEDPHVSWKFIGGNIPLQSDESAGAFSIASSHMDAQTLGTRAPEPDRIFFFDMRSTCVVVGGDYKERNRSSGTAAFTNDGGKRMDSCQKFHPHGYRSSVAYDLATRTWITVGPNGTDISRDDGRNWTPLKSAANHPHDTDNDWNALSLPFVVGPHDRNRQAPRRRPRTRPALVTQLPRAAASQVSSEAHWAW